MTWAVHSRRDCPLHAQAVLDGSVGVLVAVLVAVGCGLVVLVAARPVLRRLPEPELEPDESKVPYAALADRSFAIGVALIATVVGGLGWALSPAAARPSWLVLGTVVLLLAGVDARTTWLPLPLTRLAWVLMGLASVAAGVWAGWATLLQIAAGAAIAGAFYLGIWLVSRGGFGFGDVRFAPLIGAAAAAHSLTLLLWALVLGSLVGAVQGLIRLARRYRAPFPYAPAMLTGAYLALVVSAAVRT